MLDWPAVQPTLTGAGLVLRPWSAADADAVLAACQDPEIQRWTTVPTPYRPEHARHYVEELAAQQWESRAGALFAATSPDGGVLASCGLVEVDGHDLVGEIGYWVAPWARRRGVAQRAVRLLSGWALEQGGLGRVELYIAPDNTASCGVAERAGFEREGLLRSKVLHRGHRMDMAVYGLVSAPAG